MRDWQLESYLIAGDPFMDDLLKEQNMKTRIIVVTLTIVAILAGGFWWQSQAEASSSIEAFEATGSIEVREVRLASETGGKIVEVLAEEGELVSGGQPLIRLDGATLATQRAQALAGLQAAKANLAELTAGATDNQIKAAEAQLAQAQANLRLSEARLDALTAGARPEDIAALQAHLEEARSGYRALRETLTIEQVEEVFTALNIAEKNLASARFRREQLSRESYNPTFVIAAAEAAVRDSEAAVTAAKEAYAVANDSSQPYYWQVELARRSWELAQSNLSLAQARHNSLKDDKRSTQDGLEAAESAHKDAQEQVEAARSAYEGLNSGAPAEPLEAAWNEVDRSQSDLEATGKFGDETTSVEALLAQVDVAKAARDTASANLAAIKSGARQEEIEAARAQVDAAQAKLDGADVQIKKIALTAPWDGVVLSRSAEPGQLAMPGATLMEIGRLDQLEMTVYVPENQFGKVRPGQQVVVQVNAYPDRTFSGTVLRLADEAEFTPTNVQTKEDRARLVYAVTISLANPDLALKPGMIADVEF